MDRETSPKPPLCRGGCGFYGSATTEGLCSECFKKHVKRKQEELAKSLKVTQMEPTLHKAADNSGSRLKINQKPNNENDNNEENTNLPSTSQAVPTATTTSTDPNVDETTSKTKKNRCAECGKKVGLTGFTCRCGGLFCPIHRYSDKHNCTFDYREMGAEEIRRNNPTVVAEKIRKI